MPSPRAGTAFVYANGFAPEPGEHCFQLAGMFPGSMLAEETARPVPRSDGTTDRAHRTLGIPGGSHAITVSHPEAVAHQILEAAARYAVA